MKICTECGHEFVPKGRQKVCVECKLEERGPETQEETAPKAVRPIDRFRTNAVQPGQLGVRRLRGAR